MTARIFAETAPLYWAAGLPAIPLLKAQKRPAIFAWQSHQERMPTADEREAWLRDYPDGNIGLPLGPCADICFADIDSEDPVVRAALDRVLPETPWRRIGKKGAIYAYRFLRGVKPFKIKLADGSMAFEFLSSGNQGVLPPSIHPETRAPYVATAELYEVHRDLPHLPEDLEERIRTALSAGGVKTSLTGYTKVAEWVPLGARDNAMVAQAGVLARAVVRGERSLVQAIAELHAWHASYVEQTPGDRIDVAKGVGRLVTFLNRDVLDRGRTLPKGWDADLTDGDRDRLGLQVGEQHVEWDHDRLKEFMFNVFSTSRPDSAERLEAVREVLRRLARSERLDDLDKGRLLTYIAETCKDLKLTKGNLARELENLGKQEVEGLSHKEIAEAALAELDEKRGEVRFDEGSFWRWCGTHYQRVPDVELLREIIDLYGELPFGKRASDHKSVLDTMRTIASKPLRTVETPGINFGNGFLTPDLRLLPHDPAFGATYRLPFRYDPAQAGRCQKWLAVLHRAWGGDPDYEDKVLALKQAVAAAMFGLAPRYQRAVVLYGVAASGKSVVQEVVRHLMPDGTVCSVPPHDWSDRFQPAQFVGKLLNACGELSETRNIDGVAFKTIVVGEPINAQHKNQPIFTFQARCAHWFASNHLPLSKDGSQGFTRRWLILEFGRSVPTEERILDYGSVVAAEEREAIAAWAVEAIADLERQGDYTLPSSHRQLLDEVAFRNNPVREFLWRCDELVFAPGASCTFDEICAVYRNWCLNRMVRPATPPVVMHRLREFREEPGRKFAIHPEERMGRTAMVYSGLGIRKTKARRAAA